ncbi:hypothetical protein THF1C08_200006 [Vibrio jasicida]|nr:hypothetical protein THF1C08_200006 [Vibrio jasicida]
MNIFSNTAINTIATSQYHPNKIMSKNIDVGKNWHFVAFLTLTCRYFYKKNK